MRRAAAVSAFALILGVALGLRLWNLHFGLPDWYHPDEPIKARVVLRIAGGDLNPRYFYHPSFSLYASAVTLRLLHGTGTPLDEQAAVRAGRLTVAVLGTATVALTFVLGRAIGGGQIAFVAALLLAVAPLHVVCSHYLKEDVPMTFWAVATVLASIGIARRGRRRDYWLAGLLAGVTTGTKYTGMLFLALPWLAHRERVSILLGSPPAPADYRAARRPLRLVLLGAAAGFLLVTPYALANWWQFAAGVGHEGGNVVTGLAGIAISPLPYLWTFHLRHSILPGFGLLPTGLALWGFIIALRRPAPTTRLLSAAVAGLYTVFENSPYKPPPNFDRYVIPMLPLLAVLAALAVADVRSRLAGWAERSSGGIVAGLLLVTVALPLTDAVRLDQAMRTDTRQAAREWLVAHACANDRILLEGALSMGDRSVPSYTPQLPDRCRATYCYSLARGRSEPADFDVVVASSLMYDRFLRFPSAPAEARRFYREFFAAHRPVAEFRPAYRTYGFHNPTIRIYRLRAGDPAGR